MMTHQGLKKLLIYYGNLQAKFQNMIFNFGLRNVCCTHSGLVTT